jgi:hypothetical protein
MALRPRLGDAGRRRAVRACWAAPGSGPYAERERGFGAFAPGPVAPERAKTRCGSGASLAASRASAVARPEVVRASAAPGLNRKLRSLKAQ